MKRQRKHIPLKEKLAAALSLLLPLRDRDEWRAMRVPAKKIIGLFEFHHIVYHAIGGDDKWPNIEPMLKAPHRERSGKDTSVVAKTKRISKQHEDFRRRVLAIEKKPRETGSRWPRRKINSRNDLRRRDREAPRHV